MARRTKRLWTDEEKRPICFQTTAPGVSVAQVARRNAMNANMIVKWLRDPRYAPDPETVEDLTADTSCFLPVEIIDQGSTSTFSATSLRPGRSSKTGGSITTQNDHTHRLADCHRPSSPISTVPPGLPRLISAKAPLSRP